MALVVTFHAKILAGQLDQKRFNRLLRLHFTRVVINSLGGGQTHTSQTKNLEMHTGKQTWLCHGQNKFQETRHSLATDLILSICNFIYQAL